jgi:hypothetical protein
MDEELPAPFEEYTVEIPGLGPLTILAPEGEPGYRARLPDGQVTAYPAQSGAPSPANALADITHALANPIVHAPVPVEVTPWQMRRALNAAGLRATVEAAVSAQDQDTRDGWEFATTIRRDNALINAMAPALSLTSEQVDDLFRAAASLAV